MKFEQRLYAELPFILNIPDEIYHVQGAARIIPLQIQHGLFAGSRGAIEYSHSVYIGTKEQLTDLLRDSPPYSLTQLRTVVVWTEDVDLEESEMKSPTLEDVHGEYASRLVRDRVSDESSGADIMEEARTQFEALDSTERENFERFVSLKLTARQLFKQADPDTFLDALNRMLRTYMAVVKDIFVEEVTLHHVAGTTPGGVAKVVFCDGEIIESVATIGKIPPLMRGRWLNHPDDLVEKFRDDLRTGVEPDAIDLLATRSRGLLERGARRSAIIESSAAMETAVARRIIKDIVAQGRTEEDANALLQSNQRFSDRCKGILKQESGKSIPEIDNALWSRVINHRDTYRHKIAHSDNEPSHSEAEAVVDDFLNLAKIVTSFTP